MKKFLVLFVILATVKLSSAQNEANIWYFQYKCGLDFNSGAPVALYDGQIGTGEANATISDSLGNFLFCCEWGRAYTKDGILEYSEGLLDAGHSGVAIVKWPGQEGMYYIFTGSYFGGFFYSVVDLKENNGLGAVTDLNIPVESGWDASDRVAIVKKEDSENVWVITRKFTDDAFAAYLVDENGFNPNPIISVMPDRNADPDIEWGFIKISSDKRFLVSSYGIDSKLEVCRFNAENGMIEYLYTTQWPGFEPRCIGIEFSPDSKYLYTCYYKLGSPDTSEIYQYDMQFISDSATFESSAMLAGTGSAFGLQLARDGKIYCAPNPNLPEVSQQYVSAIHKPWIRGEGCMFESNVINMYPNKVGWVLPNILVDYLLRFEWEGEPCQGYPIQFFPYFIPTPDSIVWNFDDQLAVGSLTDELSPTYSFQHAGIHEVKVDVWYSSGRYEHTSREIEILPSPQPDLGPDTLICKGASFILNTNCDADFFIWSNGEFGVSSITVSDSGTYWVKGKFSESGCEGYDTIHVGYHPPTTIDETDLEITPTTCNGASGSITGLYALGPTPFAYQWKDLTGNPFGTDIDATGLPAGQYVLTITDGNGCETTSSVYTIEDAGNLQVLDVQLTQPHCGRPDGEIVIHAFSPSGSVLQYSIDDGATYQADSVFSGLIGTSYVIRVTDENGCEGFYLANPVVLADIPGPQVQQIVVTNESDGLQNGSIDMIANGNTQPLFYSIDNGASWQINDGFFTNLQAGSYTCIVKDENNCDTIFTIEVQNIILTILEAITGPGEYCQGNTVMVPVEVENFNSVASFQLKLSYNTDNLQCEGYADVIPQLQDNLTVWVEQATGEITFQWQDSNAVTFNQTESIAELVFTTKLPGLGDITWYTGTTDSYFSNINGESIAAEYHAGEVTIYEPPEIILLPASKTVCEGQEVSIMGIAIGNQPPIDYQWIYPDGEVHEFSPFFFSITQADEGDYTLLATDAMHCTDQKTIHIEVGNNPVAAFHEMDTLEMNSGDVLDAGTGLSSYLWNTGDTTESIVINTERMYSVEMVSVFGCTGRDSIYIKLTSDEIPSNNIFIPNAFSPDGDGLNDTFTAIATSDYIQKFHMLIFDRWGGQIFESNDIMLGWDGTKHGTLLPGGMYTYKITYSIYPSFGDYSEQVRLGTVMLVR